MSPRTTKVTQTASHWGVRIATSDTLPPGVATIATGAWYDPQIPGEAGSLDKHCNPNLVTLDKGTSQLARGSAAQTCLVEVERCENPPPSPRSTHR